MYQVVMMNQCGKVRILKETTLSGVKSLTVGVNCEIEVYHLNPVDYDTKTNKFVYSRIPELVLTKRRNVHSNADSKMVGSGRHADRWTEAISKRSFLKLS